MSTLIVKLGAAGDVVRTTTLLHLIEGDVSWLTDEGNVPLLGDLDRAVEVLDWTKRAAWQRRRFDLVVNLEDSGSVGEFLKGIDRDQLFGAYLAPDGTLKYTEDSATWFDMSLSSRFGSGRADELKLQNRRSYQSIIFEGLGRRFNGEHYFLPPAESVGLQGDVALAPKAGSIWPNKNWAYFEELAGELRSSGLVVNTLPHRKSIIEHIGDIQSHRCLISGDSLPMHLALGRRIPCVTIFTCTSPWEIHDYDVQRKVVSPLLAEYFYRRDFDEKATTCIPLEDVLAQAMAALDPVPKPSSGAKPAEIVGSVE